MAKYTFKVYISSRIIAIADQEGILAPRSKSFAQKHAPTSRRGGIEAAMGDGGPVLVTWHPSYVLRLGEHTDAAAQARAQLLGDLRRAASMLAAA